MPATGNISLFDQYKNASNELKLLRDPNGPYALEVAANDNDWAVKQNDYLKSQMANAVAGGVVTGLTGANTLFSGAKSAATINDTPWIDDEIRRVNNIGNYRYTDLDQLSSDYANANFNQNIDYSKIRGMTTGQKVGNVLTSGLTGAATGAQIGGLWGGVAGLIGGLGVGAYGVATGDNKADAKEASYKTQYAMANDAALQNLDAGHERVVDDNNRNSAVNVSACGGPIRRQTIREYSAKMSRNEKLCGGKIIRSKAEGGVMYRIRVK